MFIIVSSYLSFEVICYAAGDNRKTQQPSLGRVETVIRKDFLEEVITQFVLKAE